MAVLAAISLLAVAADTFANSSHWVSIGSFRNDDYALKYLETAESKTGLRFSIRASEEKYRVLYGPFSDRADAVTYRTTLQKQGYPDAWIWTGSSASRVLRQTDSVTEQSYTEPEKASAGQGSGDMLRHSTHETFGTIQDDTTSDFGGFDGVDAGDFDDDTRFEVTDRAATAGGLPTWLEIDGSLVFGTSVNVESHRSATGTDYGGISRLRSRLNLEIEIDFSDRLSLLFEPYEWYDGAYDIQGRNQFTDEVLEDYEGEIGLQEAYLQGKFGWVDVRLGRQIVNWGRSDTLRVLDVVNPLDIREPGRADIEELRRAVRMLRTDFRFNSRWSLITLAIPEIRFDDLPPIGSEFNPRAVGLPTVRPDNFDRIEWAVRLNGVYSGWDLSLQAGELFANQARVVGPLPKVLQGRHDFTRHVGAGANWTFGSWLLKSEIAWLDGLEFAFSNEERARFDIMLGVEYFGFAETQIAFEVVNRRIFDYQRIFLGAPSFTRRDSVEWALRFSRNWFNERLETLLLLSIRGDEMQDGSLTRAQLGYYIRDGLNVAFGMIHYEAGDLPPFSAWGNNDRVFAELKLSF